MPCLTGVPAPNPAAANAVENSVIEYHEVPLSHPMECVPNLKKEVLRLGNFYQPKHSGVPFRVTFSNPIIDMWVNAFHSQGDAG